jgi:hypothetical protein
MEAYNYQDPLYPNEPVELPVRMSTFRFELESHETESLKAIAEQKSEEEAKRMI